MFPKIIDLIKNNPKISIGVIVLVIIIVLILVFTLKKDTTTTTSTTQLSTSETTTSTIQLSTSETTTSTTQLSPSTLLDKTLIAFNIKVNEQFSLEKFGETSNVVPIVFNTKDDIVNNMMEFFGYLYPKMNIDDINNLLKQYNNDKIMKDILNENKNKIYIEDIPNSIMYEDCVYDEKDDSIIADNIRVYRLILNLILNIKMKDNIKDFINSLLTKTNRTLPSNKSDITYINFAVPNDFKTNNIMSMYTKTNYTEDLEIKGNEPYWDSSSNGIECLTSQLCKVSVDIDIKNNYIEPFKTWAIINMDKIKMQFNLSMVYYLLQLNGSDTTKIYDDFNKLRTELYDSKLAWINRTDTTSALATATVKTI